MPATGTRSELTAAVTFLLLLLATATAKEDQYLEQQSRADNTQLHHRPFTNLQLTHSGYHRFGLWPYPSESKAKLGPNVPELQVGCADGAVDVQQYDSPIEVFKNTLKTRRKRRDISSIFKSKFNRHKRDISIPLESTFTFPNSDFKNSDTNQHNKRAASTLPETDFALPNDDSEKERQKRDYVRWYSSSISQQTPIFQSSYPYQISSSLPFYVPVWGNPSRIPVFFPAKPILFNPGYPVRNRPGVQPAPTPRPTTDPTFTPDGVKITIGERGNFPMYEDDRPIWGVVESDEPASAARPSSTTTARPMRKPATPPLIHRPNIEDSNRRPAQSQNQRPVQNQTPRPVQSQTQRPSFSQQGGFTGTQFQPIQPPSQPATTQRSVSSPNEPDRCVWAIISCCSPISTVVRENCFEQLGCSGSFWDQSPCSREVTSAALNAVQKFYDQQS